MTLNTGLYTHQCIELTCQEIENQPYRFTFYRHSYDLSILLNYSGKGLGKLTVLNAYVLVFLNFNQFYLTEFYHAHP